MTFTKATPFQEAVDKLGSRSVLGSRLRTAEWQEVETGLTDRAFFSAGVEDVRFLENAKNFLDDVLTGARKNNAQGQSYISMDRSKFVKQLQDYANQNNIGPLGPTPLTNIRRQARLELIYDTQIKSARDYGYWKQGQDQDILDAFPFQRFVRVQDVKTPRRRSNRFAGMVRRKDDLEFWTGVNSRAEGGFGVPWGPWGFNSGMDVEDVSIEDGQALAGEDPALADLLRLQQPVLPIEKEFNEGLQASLRGISTGGRQQLQDYFGSQIDITGDVVRWMGAPTKPVVLNPPTIGSQLSPVTPSLRKAPVSQGLNLQVQGESLSRAKDILTVIDSVHDDGQLPQIPLTNKIARGSDGTFTRTIGGQPVALAINRKRSSTAMNSGFHETGHFLDLAALGSAGTMASESHPDLQEWRNAVAATKAIQAITAARRVAVQPGHRKYLNYLLEPREIFARSYAQFIAEKSGRADLLKELQILRTNPFMPDTFQWTEADFVPVKKALEDVFRKKGWL